MKKLIFGAIALSVFAVNAQIKNDRGTFTKPEAGEVIVEINATPNVTGGGVFSLNDPFLNNLSDGLNTGGLDQGQGFDAVNGKYIAPLLKFRYFQSENFAFRAQFNFVTANNTVNNDGKKNTVGRTGFALAVGFEKHKSGAERLSTYYGADLLLGLASARSKTEDFTFSQSGFGFGLRGVAGFDYYFIPKVYLGAELGYGLGFNNFGVIKRKGTGQENDKVKESGFALAPFINPNLRIGFRF
ncbi:MAG: hypothetical protein SNJ77_09275 [Cytophagales bacterium]